MVLYFQLSILSLFLFLFLFLSPRYTDTDTDTDTDTKSIAPNRGLFMSKYIFPGADASCSLGWVVNQVRLRSSCRLSSPSPPIVLVPSSSPSLSHTNTLPPSPPPHPARINRLRTPKRRRPRRALQRHHLPMVQELGIQQGQGGGEVWG